MMSSSENIPPASHPPDHHHNHNSTTTRKQTPKPSEEPPQPPALKCPRCDSSNTKFCYYNNYSLTQPRHFCKTCRRYWTKGGALRNVPIGGGCRKTKKHKPSPSSSSCPTPSSTSASEFRFLAPPPSMDFHLGGISLPKLHPATAGVYTHFIATSGAHQPPPPPPLLPSLGMGPTTAGSCFSLDLLGLGNYATIPHSGGNSSSSSLTLGGGGGGGGDHMLTISSIESLSTINQEMHWKLQQQRLALIYGPSSIMEEDDGNNNHHHHHHQHEKALLRGEGIELFKNMESTRKPQLADVIGGGVGPTEWLFDQSIHHQTNDSSSTVNYGVTDNNNNASLVVGVTTTNCNNNNINQHQDFNNGVWTTELHHHPHYNGMQ